MEIDQQNRNDLYIVGDYNSSFSTRDASTSSLEEINISTLNLSNSSSVVFREFDLIGRKVLENAEYFENQPLVDESSLTLKKSIINKVEIFPKNKLEYPLDQPRKFDLINVLISDVQITEEQYIDGILHGNIRGTLFGQLKPLEKKDECVSCSQLVRSGGYGVDSQRVSLGNKSGLTYVRFNPEKQIDKLEIFYMGSRVWSTDQLTINENGFVGGDLDAIHGNIDTDHTKWGTFQYNFQGSSFVTVVVTGLEPNTIWDYTLFCPNEIPADANLDISFIHNQSSQKTEFTSQAHTQIDSSFYQNHSEVTKTGFWEFIKGLFGSNNTNPSQQPINTADNTSTGSSSPLSGINQQASGCLSLLSKGCLWYFILMILLSILFFILSKCMGHEIIPVKTDDDTEKIEDLEIDDKDKDTRTLLLTNVQFYTNSSDLLPSSRDELDRIAKYLNENPKIKARIIGHTDNKGSKEKNLKLSSKRAETVMSYFVDKRVSKSRLKAIGKGDAEPRTSNTTAEGRLMNRRVEVELIEKKL